MESAKPLAISPIKQDKQNGPWCDATVHVSQHLRTMTYRDRERRTKAKGIPMQQCGAPSVFSIEGRTVCRRHAAELALAYVLGEKPVPPRKRDYIIV